MQALVLDLRDNPGGLLSAAVEISDMFLAEGVIVTTRGRDGKVRQAAWAGRSGTLPDFPMAVLVNRYSASASEIVAACLQDHKRATVIGQRTHGKGTVQEVLMLEEGLGAMKLTTASYWRPSEKNIHRTADAKEEDDWGVRPNEDFEIALEKDELTELRLWRQKRDVYRRDRDERDEPPKNIEEADPQLRRAIELMEKRSRARGRRASVSDWPRSRPPASSSLVPKLQLGNQNVARLEGW